MKIYYIDRVHKNVAPLCIHHVFQLSFFNMCLSFNKTGNTFELERRLHDKAKLRDSAA